MKMLRGLIVMFCAVTSVLAAARVYPHEPKPAKYACQDGCYLSELKRVLPYNKPYYPKGKCEVYTCQTTNQTYWYSCGIIAKQSGCRVVQDLSRNYPDCCSEVICDTTTAAPSAYEYTRFYTIEPPPIGIDA